MAASIPVEASSAGVVNTTAQLSVTVAAGPTPEKSWLPVESNPDVFNAYAKALGWPTSEFVFLDVLSTEDWALETVPPGVHAVLLLFPITPAHEAAAAEEAAALAAAPAAAGAGGAPGTPFFLHQTVGNACGTIALVHACVNAASVAGGAVSLAPDSALAAFYSRCRGLRAAERAAALADDAALEVAHAATAHGGQSAVVDDTDYHFVAFVGTGGRLWELDGRKPAPVDHGPLPADEPGRPAPLLREAARVAREFMARAPESVGFAVMALAGPPPPAEEEEGEGEGAAGASAT